MAANIAKTTGAGEAKRLRTDPGQPIAVRPVPRGLINAYVLPLFLNV